jgi:glycyl-tRNA synthetase
MSTQKSSAKSPESTASMEQIVSLAKRRGFIFQGSEIYGGLAGTWDYGPYGVTLKNNIKQLWWRYFVEQRDDMYGVDAAILMNARVWEASGHTGAGFADPLVEDKVTRKRYRVDHLLEDNGVDPAGMDLAQMSAKVAELKLKSPEGNPLSEARQFNLMFETRAGVVEDSSAQVYLRPETAQGMFVNFKNIIDSVHPKLPFGLAQIGKAFRNEITPKDFIFRTREFEQMEIEYFIDPKEWEKQFDDWQKLMYGWMELIGLPKNYIHELDVPQADRAHYSKKTIDFEFDFPFGKKELYGLAYRTDFDLSNHTKHSDADLSYLDPTTNQRLTPHVIEPTFGVDRTVLAILSAAYTEEKVGEGDTRVVLKLNPNLAPVKVAVSPLLRNKPELSKLAQSIYKELKAEFGAVMYDDNGNIGKRYRRQDEIGTPLCIVVDFDSLEDNAVTVRNRDTLKQTRIKIDEIVPEITKHLDNF